MRCLKRNQKPFHYALFLRKEKREQGHGYKLIYGEPVAVKGNISPANGTTSVEQFGSDVDYDRVIVLDDPDCPIDEKSLLFIDVVPSRNNDGDYVYDYVVKKLARSLNSVAVAISKVKVS